MLSFPVGDAAAKNGANKDEPVSETRAQQAQSNVSFRVSTCHGMDVLLMIWLSIVTLWDS